MTARNGHAPSGTGMGVSFFGFHTFVACHVNPLTAYQLPLTSYQLPLAICHSPLSSLASTRTRTNTGTGTRTRPYPFPLPFRTRRHFFQFARSVRNVCHNGLSNDNVPRGGYYMQQAEWPKDAWLADCLTACLAAWLYSISIGACFKSIFIIIFISFFFLSYFPFVFLFFLFLFPWFFCIYSSFIRHYHRTMRAVCRLLLWLTVCRWCCCLRKVRDTA